jgi:hypothetical protein
MMASFTDIPTSTLANGKYVTYDLLTALRDNSLACAWHPYDKVTIGDAATGLIYDFGVSGAVANVVTPDFADGWDYMIVVNELSHNSGTTPTYLQMELYRETSASYVAGTSSLDAGTAAAASISGQIILPWMRSSRVTHIAQHAFGNGNFGVASVVGFGMTTAQKVLRARLSYTTGSIDAGKLYLYRRGVFAAG